MNEETTQLQKALHSLQQITSRSHGARWRCDMTKIEKIPEDNIHSLIVVVPSKRKSSSQNRKRKQIKRFTIPIMCQCRKTND